MLILRSSLRFAPHIYNYFFSSSSSSTGAARRSTSPFRMRRSEEKKAAEDDKPSSATAIEPSDASAVAASNSYSLLREQQTLWGYAVARRKVLYGCVVCAYDVALLAMLSVPLVELLPLLAASVGTKSGNKRIFAAADVNAFPSIYDLFYPSLQIWRSQQSRLVVVK
ncbi:uncharacterized protein MONOS_11902 [Monocercomonoides exilis]|uniref:uncharacterized protein n=1 Tax=Monocercomonoides exilis TaxID=2049356 RepID=UPI00355ACC34|nr:hypothetical protein MONOS_11902 [Monocercomonoides exilis]|eukprot:MONOS_11902.1-p1 / transcript=MONOS_11902.1 / gene=MONOS_11902 / organism=Monocercomonoides_exilis_PA203 / gene_product=unspecified product / transcript_product=unspecified product / location=Mono_scaffold00623:10567-11123(-) / protein_length=167 / sequence_SO=supercontig / SO=protein_coding / is_pseudo=false